MNDTNLFTFLTDTQRAAAGTYFHPSARLVALRDGDNATPETVLFETRKLIGTRIAFLSKRHPKARIVAESANLVDLWTAIHRYPDESHKYATLCLMLAQGGEAARREYQRGGRLLGLLTQWAKEPPTENQLRRLHKHGIEGEQMSKAVAAARIAELVAQAPTEL